MEANLLADLLCYVPKQSIHVNSQIRYMCEKAQTEDFCAHYLTDQNVTIIPNTPHEEHAQKEDNALALHQLSSDFPDKDDEDFDSDAHRVISIYEPELSDD